MNKVMKKYQVSGFEVIEYDEVSSTNTVAEAMALSELSDKMVILTWHQSQGRGQAANKWESEPWKNIAMTVVFRPERMEAVKQFAVSMVIALGCLDFVNRYVPGGTVKWPNDIYVGDSKIAGILIEHRVAGTYILSSLCGIGLNINQAVFRSDAPNPVSLVQLTGKELDLNEALKELLQCIGQRYDRIKDYVALEDDFRKNMYRANGIYNWEDADGPFRAAVSGIDEYGQLMLEDTEGQQRLYAFKEVKYD